MSKKKVKWLIVYGVVAVGCACMLWTIYAYYSGFIKPSSAEIIPFLALTQISKNNSSCIIKVVDIVGAGVFPDKIEWRYQNNTITNKGNFPIASGEVGKVVNGSVSIVWFDTDSDQKLSKNDEIEICYSENISQGQFSLLYISAVYGIEEIGHVKI